MGDALKLGGHDVGNCDAEVRNGKEMRDDLQGAACGKVMVSVEPEPEERVNGWSKVCCAKFSVGWMGLFLKSKVSLLFGEKYVGEVAEVAKRKDRKTSKNMDHPLAQGLSAQGGSESEGESQDGNF
jgi:hypothetical protein